MFILRCLVLINIYVLSFGQNIDQLIESNSFDKINRIVDGFETDIYKNPWQVGLYQNKRFFCGGSIIGRKWILTAAHCTCRLNETDVLQVRVGSSYRSKGGSIITVKNYQEHENFHDCDNEDDLDYDFSLLELSRPLKFSRKIRPIALPSADTQIADGTLCLVSGWGLLKANTTNLPRKLRAANVPIVNQAHCAEQYKEIGWNISDRMICAGYEGGIKDACNGDSGGPLSIDGDDGASVLIGVVSTGLDCAVPHFSGIYSRITEARPWIKKVTGI